MAADKRIVTSNSSTLPTADITPAGTITDNSGGTAPSSPNQNTIAVITNPDLSAWDGIVPPTAAQATALLAALTAIKAAIAQLAAKQNTTSTAVAGLETATNALKDAFVLEG